MRFWIVLVCAAAVGCGGNRSDPEAAAPVPRQAPAERRAPDDRPVILAFGDSLTAGFGADPGRSYPDYLQQELDRRGARYRVVNAGISGETSTGGLARLDAALAEKPAIVILELGANDGLRGIPVAITRRNLEQMIEAFQKAGARVVLAGMTLPPNYGPDYIRAFEEIYRSLAAKYKTALIPFLLQGVAGTSRYMQPDGLHPTVEGYRIVADNVMKVLAPLL
jgi:acyl-CoA thioesterase-1